MKIKPMLDSWPIDNIEEIEILEARNFAEHDIVGKKGSGFQDMGGQPARIRIIGSVWGDEAREKFLKEIRDRYYAGAPVTFVADIVSATSVQYVVIESLYFSESARHPEQIDYTMLLSESPPPPPPPNPFGAIDTGLLDQAGSFLDSITGALDALDMLGSLPNLSNPAPALAKALDGVTAATKDIGSLGAPLGKLLS